MGLTWLYGVISYVTVDDVGVLEVNVVEKKRSENIKMKIGDTLLQALTKRLYDDGFCVRVCMVVLVLVCDLLRRAINTRLTETNWN